MYAFWEEPQVFESKRKVKYLYFHRNQLNDKRGMFLPSATPFSLIIPSSTLYSLDKDRAIEKQI
jgi:hypothetical protein